MAPRAYWKGYLRLSHVAVPVQLFAAVASEHELPLHQIHRPTGERVRHEKVAAGVGRVEQEDIALGYEYETGRHVLIEDEDLQTIAPEVSDTIELDQFVHVGQLDDIYIDRPFFVVPSDKVGDEGYRTVREALARTGRIGIGEMVLHRRTRLVAVRPCGRGLLLQTLRYREELRSVGRFFGELVDAVPDEAELRLACELIDRRTAPFRPERFRDDYEAALRAMVEAKVSAGRARRAALPSPDAAQVIDLGLALRRSLDDIESVVEPAPRQRRA